MKYTYQFITYNFLEVEAENEEEAFEKAQERYYSDAEIAWDECDVIPPEEAYNKALKYGHHYAHDRA